MYKYSQQKTFTKITVHKKKCNVEQTNTAQLHDVTHLWVLKESLFVVHTATLSIGRAPLAMRQRLIPRLLYAEERRVDDTAQRQYLEILTEILERHPVTTTS